MHMQDTTNKIMILSTSLTIRHILLLLVTSDVSYQTTTGDHAKSKDYSEKKEYCQLEIFRAECRDNEVIFILTALYGRMHLGRCVKRDWGYIGCASDVVPHLDRICSGRRVCEFPVADLDGNQPCPGDLAPYLEPTYKCVPVIMAPSHKCNVHEPITITDLTGHIASVITLDSGRGGPDCPWRIQVHPGQQVNITLVNFARIGLPSEWGTSAAPRPKICYQLAGIRERQYSRTLTECEGAPRESHAYTSTSNVVEIDVIVAKVLKVYFLLQFETIGCANPPLQTGMSLRREGDNALARCNTTGAFWALRCIGSTWEGQMDNCTKSAAAASSIEGWNVAQLFVNDVFPYSILIVVSVGVALGVFVGGVLLVCAARYFKRRQDGSPEEDFYPCPYPPESGKTLVLSCEMMTPTAAQDPSMTDLSQLQTPKQLQNRGSSFPLSSSMAECQCPYALYDSFQRAVATTGCDVTLTGPKRFRVQRGTHIYESPQQLEPHEGSLS